MLKLLYDIIIEGTRSTAKTKLKKNNKANTFFFAVHCSVTFDCFMVELYGTRAGPDQMQLRGSCRMMAQCRHTFRTSKTQSTQRFYVAPLV